MATKSGTPRQGSRGNKVDLKKFRSDVAKLKAKGLLSKGVDARSQKPTRYMKHRVKEFDDVLQGKAKVVHTKTRAQAKDFGDLRHVGKSVVVPVVNKTERVRFNAKTGEITSSARENGKRLKKTIRARNIDLYNIKTYPRGDNIRYRMPFGGGGSYQQFDTPEDLFAFMFQYESKPKNPYRDWQKYVQIITLGKSDSDEDEGEE